MFYSLKEKIKQRQENISAYFYRDRIERIIEETECEKNNWEEMEMSQVEKYE